ncbi:hypothetical protein EMIT0373P_50020 [Pseudomonas chlororaphis]
MRARCAPSCGLCRDNSYNSIYNNKASTPRALDQDWRRVIDQPRPDMRSPRDESMSLFEQPAARWLA